jgi:hypothetical protein
MGRIQCYLALVEWLLLHDSALIFNRREGEMNTWLSNEAQSLVRSIKDDIEGLHEGVTKDGDAVAAAIHDSHLITISRVCVSQLEIICWLKLHFYVVQYKTHVGILFYKGSIQLKQIC